MAVANLCIEHRFDFLKLEDRKVPEPITIATAIVTGMLCAKEAMGAVASKFQRDRADREARAEEHHDDTTVMLSNQKRISDLENYVKQAQEDSKAANLARIAALEEKLALHRTLIETQTTLRETMETLQSTQQELKRVQEQLALMSIDMVTARAQMEEMRQNNNHLSDELKKYEENRKN